MTVTSIITEGTLEEIIEYYFEHKLNCKIKIKEVTHTEYSETVVSETGDTVLSTCKGLDIEYEERKL